MKYVLALFTICNVLALPPCNEDILMKYLANMQIINPEMIINLSTLDSLPKLCDKIAENLNQLSTYLQSCTPFEHSLFTKLIQGVDTLYNKLCTNTKFARDFINHHNCLHTSRDAFVACNGPEDWIENSNNEIICE
ncbi:uncharacterized protein LOC116175469 [Photinus pyralis]|uniref:uncharacterized protein LOC116175469 n=1 Tax=Photinus pyralis TaxID=7054 RepID=UPI0012674F73|nr:uncharacterized protein LOC116175469 [Photinus pyralis]